MGGISVNLVFALFRIGNPTAVNYKSRSAQWRVKSGSAGWGVKGVKFRLRGSVGVKYRVRGSVGN